ncbi:MAG TPA: hypothetical protein VIK45_14195 [Candidatus Dormibacteraeota bacterium]
MLTRTHTALFAVLAALVLILIAACGGGQSTAPTQAGSTAVSGSGVTQAPSRSSDQLGSAAVSAVELERIAHQVFQGSHAEECYARGRSTCPVTDRLAARLSQLTAPPASGPGPVAPFCRCQNGASSMTVTTEPTRDGGIAHVTLNYGSSFQSKIDLIVVRADSRALVDDTQCTGGGQSTSLYAAQLTGCAAPMSASCTGSGAASASFGSPESLPQSGPPPIASASVSGDSFTVNFRSGTPQFEVTRQSTASFTRDASGQPVTLPGSAGVKITLRGFRGDRSNLSSVPQSMSSTGSLLRQVTAIGDSEGVVSWAAGLSSPGCTSVTASGSTLTFHFIPVAQN